MKFLVSDGREPFYAHIVGVSAMKCRQFGGSSIGQAQGRKRVRKVRRAWVWARQEAGDVSGLKAASSPRAEMRLGRGALNILGESSSEAHFAVRRLRPVRAYPQDPGKKRIFLRFRV
jgi:hypothetical protein